MSEQTFKERIPAEAQGTVGPSVKVYFMRETSGGFAMKLAKRIPELNISEIVSSNQSESDGYISLTLFYK